MLKNMPCRHDWKWCKHVQRHVCEQHDFDVKWRPPARPLRRTIFLDELKLSRKPEIKPDNEAALENRRLVSKAFDIPFSLNFRWRALSISLLCYCPLEFLAGCCFHWPVVYDFWMDSQCCPDSCAVAKSHGPNTERTWMCFFNPAFVASWQTHEEEPLLIFVRERGMALTHGWWSFEGCLILGRLCLIIQVYCLDKASMR